MTNNISNTDWTNSKGQIEFRDSFIKTVTLYNKVH